MRVDAFAMLSVDDIPEDANFDAEMQAAAQRRLGCDLRDVERTLLGREPYEMDRQAVRDWAVLLRHLASLFWLDAQSPFDAPPGLEEVEPR
jgi:hypothetical protein